MVIIRFGKYLLCFNCGEKFKKTEWTNIVNDEIWCRPCHKDFFIEKKK